MNSLCPLKASFYGRLPRPLVYTLFLIVILLLLLMALWYHKYKYLEITATAFDLIFC